MRWEVDDEQQLVQKALQEWLTDVAASERVRAWNESGDPTDFEAMLADAGWSGVGYPEERGGSGGALLEQALIAESLGHVAAPSSAWLATALALHALGSEADALISAGLAGALVVPADAPPAEADCTLRVTGDRLSGTVSNVLGADRADVLVVPARVSGRRRFIVVRADSPGVTLTPHRMLDASRSVAEVTFDDAVGEMSDASVREGLEAATAVAGVLVAADSLGALSRMLDLTVEYSKQREQFGQPIGSFQAVKHEAATMLVAVEASRSIVYYAAQSVAIRQTGWPVHAAIAKAQVCPAAVSGADSALRLHGAIGYTWEYDLHLLYKRAKLNEVLLGGAGRWNDRIADSLPLVVS